MDPITVAIVAALTAGVLKGATEVAQRGLEDAYSALKTLIQRKFGGSSEVAKAVDNIEARPDSQGRQQTLAEEVKAAGADKDPEILQAAQTLQERVAAQPGGQQVIDTVIKVIGNFNATAVGGSTATVTITGTPPAVPPVAPPTPAKE